LPFSQLHANTVGCASYWILGTRPVSNRDDDGTLAALLNMLDLLHSQLLSAHNLLGHVPRRTPGLKRSSSSNVSLTGLSKWVSNPV
jgi:hypothetical protein